MHGMLLHHLYLEGYHIRYVHEWIMLRNYAIGIRMKMRVQYRDSSPLFIIICSSTSPVTSIGATFKLAKLVNEILLTIKDPFIH